MSKKLNCPRLLFVIAVVCLSFVWGCTDEKPIAGSASQKPGTFIIAGSGSNLPITGKLIEGFTMQSGLKVEMPDSIGSSGAIKATNEGAINLGLLSRPLKPKEVEMGLKQIPYARVGIVVGVNPDVPDDNLTSQELVEIFQGTKSKWTNGEIIIVLSREKGDSTNSALEKHLPGFKQALEESLKSKRWQVYYTDQEEADGIIKTPFSIGFTDTGAMSARSLKIKPMKINGIVPSAKTVKDGSYPLFKDLYFVYKEPLPENTSKFLQFVKSDKGQEIITTYGGIPLKG